MQSDARIENHKPAPLMPLGALLSSLKCDHTMIYLEAVYKDGARLEHGWVHWRLDTFSDPFTNFVAHNKDLDFEKSMGRTLQPGEKLIISYLGK